MDEAEATRQPTTPPGAARQPSSVPHAPSATTGPPRPPSVHVRALVTWLVIFPEVALVNWVLSPAEPIGATVLRSLIVTVVVIPPAVYLFVPVLLRVWARHITDRER
jgi:antibiotic biosynthesis monooxygenase (ABM) superfamily enzyme